MIHSSGGKSVRGSSVTQAYSKPEIRPSLTQSITSPIGMPESSMTVLVIGERSQLLVSKAIQSRSGKHFGIGHRLLRRKVLHGYLHPFGALSGQHRRSRRVGCHGGLAANAMNISV